MSMKTAFIVSIVVAIVFIIFFIIINLFKKMKQKISGAKILEELKQLDKASGVVILEILKQLDYELYQTQGFSHLSEEQWNWLIYNFKSYNTKQKDSTFHNSHICKWAFDMLNCNNEVETYCIKSGNCQYQKNKLASSGKDVTFCAM